MLAMGPYFIVMAGLASLLLLNNMWTNETSKGHEHLTFFPGASPFMTVEGPGSILFQRTE